jgi:transposase
VYGGLELAKYGKQNYRQNRQINFGSPVQDNFGTIATMRQRSLQSLGRGRESLGNEARYFHT